MRQFYNFQPAKLDELNSRIVFFFESIYYQSFTKTNNWDNIFIHPEILPIFNSCYKFKRLLKQVHNDFIAINTVEKRLIFDSARSTTNLAGVCSLANSIAHKDDLSNNIGDSIHKLYHYLYYQLPANDAFINVYGTLKSHYENLKRINRKISKCPFCGLLPIKPLNSKTRQTYDHYLPLSKYPFTGITTNNFVPTCKDCNEDHKVDKDVLHRTPTRISKRPLFFPYGTYDFKPHIDFVPTQFNSATLEISRCTVAIRSEENKFNQEIESWTEIYEIDDRYRNTIMNDSDSWYEEYLEFLTQQEIDGALGKAQDNFKVYMNALDIQGATSITFLKRPFFIKMNELTNVFK